MVNTPSGNHPNVLQLSNLFSQYQPLVSKWDKIFLSEEYGNLFWELLAGYLLEISKQNGIYQEDLLEEIMEILNENHPSIVISITPSFPGNMKLLNFNIKGYILSYQFKIEGNQIQKWEHSIANSKCAPFWFMYSIANDYFIAYENIVREYNQIQKRESLLRSNTVMKSGIQASGTSPSVDPIITDVVWRTKKTLNLSATSRVTEKWEELKAQQLNKNPTK